MQRKWIVLSEVLKKTGEYYKPRLTPRALSSRFYAGRAVMQETPEELGHRTIKAYAALWPTYRKEWYELGTVWVSEELRGNGLVRKLMTELICNTPTDANLLLFTKKEQVMCIAGELGFIPATTQSRPGISRWSSDVGVVCRLPETIYPVVPSIGDSPPLWGIPEEGKRWMFVRTGKAHAE